MGLAPGGGTCLRDLVVWSVMSWTRAPEVLIDVAGKLKTVKGMRDEDGADLVGGGGCFGGMRKVAADDAMSAGEDAGTLDFGSEGGSAELACSVDAVEDIRARRRVCFVPF